MSWDWKEMEELNYSIIGEIENNKSPNYHKIPEGRGLVVCDVDMTLVDWNSDSPEFEINGNPLAPMKENIRTLKLLKTASNRTVMVWSQSGADWAEKVVKKLGLEDYVDYISAKPHAHIDDLEPKHWMGKNLYRKEKSIFEED